MSFLSPLASLVALAVVLPLLAFALLERRARRVSAHLGLQPPPLRSRLGVPGAIAAVAGLLGIAAAQPVISGTQTRVGRSDVQVYVLVDTSRSMLARRSRGAPERFDRARRLALQLRRELADVPFGIISLTDRALPHLFPTLDADVYASTLRDAVGIERPPPSGSEPVATAYDTLGDVATNNFYKPSVQKRLLIIFSDGESRYFDDVVLARELKKAHVHVLFVQLWNADEKIYLAKNNVDPGYRPDPASTGAAQRIASAGDGEVVDEDPAAIAAKVKAFVGHGRETKLREQRTRVSLGPYVALAALLPLGFVLLRRNL
jgi:von Willebrand factor type A domain